jgi:hypothetical protein
MKQKKKSSRLLCVLFLFCFFSQAASPQEPESGDAAVAIPRESWNRFLTDWTALKALFGTLEERHQRLKEHYDPLPPKLAELERTLAKSEETSRILREQMEVSGTQLAGLNDSLKKQTVQTASLEREVRFYKAAFFISIGAGAAGITSGVLLSILK